MSLEETGAGPSKVENNICTQCQGKIFQDRFWEYGRRSWSKRELLTSKASCSFCSLVYEASKLNTADALADPDFSEHATISLQDFTVFDGLGNPPNGRALYPIGRSIKKEPPYCVARKPVGAAKGPVKPQADFALFATWLSTCESEHVSKCGSNSLIPPVYLGFRVIDVQDKCVVHPTSACRYVALSYMWGGVGQFTLRNETYKLLHRPNSISSERDGISRTALDAMEACRAMKLRYLWVDALCIIQDDPLDKAAQIPHMDLVYRNAVLTIVAAAGPHCNAGLPGIQPRTVVQHTMVVKDSEITTAPRCVCHLMKSSAWDGRRWTLQEKLLSRRLIVFTERLIFFRCRENIFREDFGSEPILNSSTGHRYSDSYSLFYTAETSSKSVRYPLYIWLNLVDDYLGRNQSADDEILDAFGGILTALTTVMGPFIFGMPAPALGNTLLWQHTPRQRRLAYPSWSWAGWVFPHAVESHHYSRQILMNYPPSSLTKFFRLSSDDVVPISQKSLDGLQDLTELRDHMGDRGVSIDHVRQHLKLRESVDRSHLLIFWSSCVKLSVPVSTDVAPTGAMGRDPTEPWRLYLSNFGARPWRVEQEANNPYIWVQQEWFEGEEGGGDLELVLICVDEWGADAQFMLIKWKGSIAYRIDAPEIRSDGENNKVTARISVNTWLSMKPTRKLIALG